MLDVNLLEKLFDALSTHHGDELAAVFLIQLAFAFIGDHFANNQFRHFAVINNHERFKIKHPLKLTQRDVQ